MEKMNEKMERLIRSLAIAAVPLMFASIFPFFAEPIRLALAESGIACMAIVTVLFGILCFKDIQQRRRGRTCILIQNFSKTIPEETTEILKERLERILGKFGVRVTINVYDHPRDVWPKWWLFLKKLFFRADPDKSDGESNGSSVILYKRAFEGDEKRLLHIALHEIGHFLDINPLTFLWQPWRERRADKFAAKFGF